MVSFHIRHFNMNDNNLMENLYVMGNKVNYDWLMESKEQLETGKITDVNATANWSQLLMVKKT